MPRPSKVDRLPPSIKQAIGDLRRDGNTIDEIMAHIRSLGIAEISRTGLGVHIQEIDAVGEDMRRDHAMAAALVQNLGDEPDDKVARLNVELLQSAIMKFNLALRTRDVGDLDPAEFDLISRAVKNIASAGKINVDRTDKLEKRAADRARRQAAETAAKAMTQRGFSKDTIESIKSQILAGHS